MLNIRVLVLTTRDVNHIFFLYSAATSYRPRMTYTVSSGTLNPTQLNNHQLTLLQKPVYSGYAVCSVKPFQGQRCQLVTLYHPGLAYIFNFWHLGTLALRAERQSAQMAEIKNIG